MQVHSLLALITGMSTGFLLASAAATVSRHLLTKFDSLMPSLIAFFSSKYDSQKSTIVTIRTIAISNKSALSMSSFSLSKFIVFSL